MPPNGEDSLVVVDGAERAHLRDLSPNGFSFWSDLASEELAPGTLLRNITFRRDGFEETVVDGEVRYSVQDASGRTLCGVRVLHPSVERALAWQSYAHGLVYPDTSVGGAFNEAVWRLYEASGYFNLSGKDPSQFEELKEPTFYANHRFDAAPNIGFRVVWPSHEPVASVSMVRAYRRTWLGHQMAKARGAAVTRAESLQGLRALYRRAYEPLVGEPTCAWLLGYCEAHVRWMRSAHHDFATRYMANGSAHVSAFRLYEVDTGAHAALPGSGATVDISPASALEREVIAAVLAGRHPRAYVEALDLTHDRLDLAVPSRAWQQAGLARGRTLLVARIRGRPAAAAIMETAEQGTNVFCLLDGVRLVALGPLAAPTREHVFAQLLADAAKRYAALGRKRFVYFCESDEAEHTKTLRDLGEGFLWIVSSELLPAFLQHVSVLTDPT